MKPAVLGTAIGLVVALAAVAGSCSIHHRSDQYTCTINSNCTDGRICNAGFCIVPGSIDAAIADVPRGSNCPAPCTSCNTTDKTCTIDCGTANCTGAVTCPAGYNCDILCNGDNACRNGINCLLADSCYVECGGKQACQGIACGPGPCDVDCFGPASCREVRCGSSCACNVTCTGDQSCTDTIVCSSLGCKSGSGCTSVPLLCHSC